MHFWITKWSGSGSAALRYGYPSVPFPTSSSGRIYSSDRSNSNGDNPCHPRPTIGNADSLGADNINTENILLPLVQLPVENLPNSTTLSRELPGFSDFTDEELARFRLCCSIWITFVLATGFIVTAKFYLDHSSHEATKFETSLEILVYCGLLVTLLLSVWFYSVLRSTEDTVLQVQNDPIPTHTAANRIANESIGLPAVGQNPQPPLHDLAILIPPSRLADESPPPSYDKVAVR